MFYGILLIAGQPKNLGFGDVILLILALPKNPGRPTEARYSAGQTRTGGSFAAQPSVNTGLPVVALGQFTA